LIGDLTGGGHKYGAGRGKSEFPQSWSDDDIIDAIESVANDPNADINPAYWFRSMKSGIRRGLKVSVIISRYGEILTGYPS
jgi:hypothetical protein